MTDANTTMSVVGSDDWYREEAARCLDRLGPLGRGKVDRLCGAAGVEIENLSGRAQRTLAWLAYFEVDGLVDLFHASRDVSFALGWATVGNLETGEPIDFVDVDHVDEGWRALAAALLEAVSLPEPATNADAARYGEVLLQRVAHVRVALEAVLVGPSLLGEVGPSPLAERAGYGADADTRWEAQYLRERIAGLPPSGYRTGPSPGIPVEETLGATESDPA